MPVDLKITGIIGDFVILILMALPMGYFHKFVKPYKRGFYCDDETLRYPYLPSTVTRHELIAVGMTVPIVLIILTELYRVLFMEKKCANEFRTYRYGARKVHRFFVRIYVFLGYFFVGVCFNQLMVDIGKYSIGRHRPHFLAVCQPDIGWKECAGDHAYISNFNCTGPDANLIHEAKLSFYSGHASFSFFVAWYTSLYLRARLYRPVYSRLVVPLLQFCLFFGATYVSYTRISDYKHHWSDVLMGALLGSSIGIFLALYIAEVFKRREIPPSHDGGCQFGLIPIDRKNVASVEDCIGVGIPSGITTRNIITAKQIVLVSDSERGPTMMSNTAPSDATKPKDGPNSDKNGSSSEYHLLQPTE